MVRTIGIPMHLGLYMILGLALMRLGAVSASAQTPPCEPAWRSWGVTPGVDNPVHETTTWDPDGAGPLPAQLVAGGSFITAGGATVNSIARWDGMLWHPFGPGFVGGSGSTRVEAITTWDPDGAGPQPDVLVAGGLFTSAGGLTLNNIARWDGSQWLPFGSGMAGPSSPSVSALTSWDPDGSGPEPAQLVAAGRFITAGGVTVNGIARWDGTQWLPFGTGMNGSVLALTTWDPDGPGPQPAQLVAGGGFTTAGGALVYFIARWDGMQWLPFGEGMYSQVNALTTWDPDGAGPLPARLVAGGIFITAGGTTVNGIALWDGTQWRPFGSGMTGAPTGFTRSVNALTTWDPDGAGPLPSQLVAGGFFRTAGGVTVNGIARWDGTRWLPSGSGMAGFSAPSVEALTTWDPDGAGPLTAQLVAGGGFTTAGGLTVNHIARWDGSQWLTFGLGMNSNAFLNDLTTWDPDGPGPQPDQLVAGGQIETAGGVMVNGIARWDGTRWLASGSGMNGTVGPLTTWDPDGAGPQPAQLVAGGAFTTAGGVPVNFIARWDGSQWLPFGKGMNSFVFDLTTWDPDGDGPLPPQLVAGGAFTTAGGVTVNNIARWDGTQWLSFGKGMNRTVDSLTTWDPDGAGPQPAQLVAGGWFTTAGGVTVNSIARWDGTQWLPFGSGMNSSVWTLTTWDPDGAGTLPAQLVAGGLFTTAGGVTVNNIARWDGTQWLPFGKGMNSSVDALATWDPDGAGPQPAQLVAGGGFTTAGGLTVNHIARWDGSQWLPFGTGMSGRDRLPYISALTTWDPDGAGPLPDQLVAGGTFAFAGGVPAVNLAWWGCPLPPPCPGTGPGACSGADWDENGVIDFNDLLAFLNDSNSAAPCADLTGDGIVDFNDLLAFLTLFNTPC
jgi:hypothetical protein